jgi:hypothetical protein
MEMPASRTTAPGAVTRGTSMDSRNRPRIPPENGPMIWTTPSSPA